MTEYLLKSDVMASYNTSRRHAIGIKPLLDNLITYTFPDPSLAVDGKPANYPEFPDSSLKLESDTSKPDDWESEMERVTGMLAEWGAPGYIKQGFEVLTRQLREIARLLAERGDK